MIQEGLCGARGKRVRTADGDQLILSTQVGAGHRIGANKYE